MVVLYTVKKAMNLLSKKKISVIISIFLVLLSGILSNTYRPYIYKNHIYDFHFADTISSWLSIPAGSLFFFGIQRKNKYSFSQFIAINLIGFTFFELFLGSTFDYYDLVALYLSAIVTYLIYFLYKLYKNN
jgi:hypothetical protein